MTTVSSRTHPLVAQRAPAQAKIETLGGYKLTRLSASPSVQELAKRMSAESDGVPSWTAAWKGKPADVAAALAHPSQHKAFFNDALFHGTGTRFQQDYPTYYTPTRVSVKPISADHAAKALADAFGGSQEAANGVHLVKKLAAEPGEKLVHVSWTNHDDASFDGIFAVNARTGQIRAAGWYSAP